MSYSIESFRFFWKESVISQMCSGSISLVASSLIVTFVALNGLNTPYRRIIFGLSVSDILQSFAIVVGPFFIRSDTPQAIWGIGNKHTCRFDGFLYLVGVTAMPMYTLFLCIYYVCKLKNRMTNAQFTDRVEKKLHITIIVINLCLYLTALGMDVINPSPFGSTCASAAVPAGCVHRPEVFGECDPNINQLVVIFFTAISSMAVPVSSLIGILVCMGMILWHVLMRERIFGTMTRGSPGTPSMGETAAVAGLENDIHSSGDRYLRRHRNRHRLRSSDLASSFDQSSSYPGVSMLFDEERHLSSHAFTYPLNDVNNADCSDSDRRSPLTDDATSSAQETRNVNHASNIESPECVSSSINTSASQHPYLPSNLNMISDWSNLGGVSVDVFPSIAESLNLSNYQESDRVDSNATVTLHNLETLSRLYKMELLTQACCYVLVFCLTNIPLLIMIIQVLSGIQPSKMLLRVNTLLYPLGGFFNTIVYTRWNVTSWRRKNPECSRLRAFWLVLRAGGGLPREGD